MSQGDYWEIDVPLAGGALSPGRRLMALQAHIEEEAFRRPRDIDEIVPLTTRSGTRSYVAARPYVWETNLVMSVRLFPQVGSDGVIGEVTGPATTSRRRRPIGHAQAWFYPADRMLVLWEALLYQQQEHCPAQDERLQTLWHGFEHFLLQQFPTTRSIATPSWEPLYDTGSWRDFLQRLGYASLSERAFAKSVSTEARRP